MTPGILHLAMRQGDSYSMVLTLSNANPSDPKGQTPGTPLDLTGAQAEMQIRDLFGNVLIALSSAAPTANGSTLTLGATAGTVQIALSSADTEGLPSGIYDLRIQFADGDRWTMVSGRVDVETGVTSWM